LFLVETYFKQNTEMVQNSRGNPENPVILSKHEISFNIHIQLG